MYMVGMVLKLSYYEAQMQLLSCKSPGLYFICKSHAALFFVQSIFFLVNRSYKPVETGLEISYSQFRTPGQLGDHSYEN